MSGFTSTANRCPSLCCLCFRHLNWFLALVFLLPVRDMLSFGLWSWGFFTRRVLWRDSHIHIARDGSVQIVEGA